MNWSERDILCIRHPWPPELYSEEICPFSMLACVLEERLDGHVKELFEGAVKLRSLGVKNSWRVEVCIFRFFEQVFSGGDALNISEMSTTIALCKTLLPQRKVCNIVPLPAWVKELDLSSSSSSSCSEMKQNLILFYASSYSPRLPQSKIIATWRIVLKK